MYAGRECRVVRMCEPCQAMLGEWRASRDWSFSAVKASCSKRFRRVVLEQHVSCSIRRTFLWISPSVLHVMAH